MNKQISKSEPQKAPYVTPKILTLKVDLSFAAAPSSKWFPVSTETEMPESQAKAWGKGMRPKCGAKLLAPATVGLWIGTVALFIWIVGSWLGE